MVYLIDFATRFVNLKGRFRPNFLRTQKNSLKKPGHHEMSQIQQINFMEIEQLYQEFGHKAYSLAFRILKNPEAAEKIVQDVFLDYWHSPFQHHLVREEFMSWLLLMVRIKCLNTLPRRVAIKTPTIINTVNPASANLDAGVGVAYSQSGMRKFKIALDALPNEQKKLIELAFFTGLDNRQIAEVSKMPVSTVKSTIRQVLLQLKGTLMRRHFG